MLPSRLTLGVFVGAVLTACASTPITSSWEMRQEQHMGEVWVRPFDERRYSFIAAQVGAPPGTVLHGATLAEPAEPPCRSFRSIRWLRVDEALHDHGPAELGGAHGVIFGFDRPWGGDEPPLLDLDLQTSAGERRCMRVWLRPHPGGAT